MLTEKYTPVNQKVKKYNVILNQAMRFSGKNDENLMIRCQDHIMTSNGKFRFTEKHENFER